MKRVRAACLYQTLHFAPKEQLNHDLTLREMQKEVEHYKLSLKKARRKFEILREETQADGSIVVEVKKEVSGYDCGEYI